MDAIEMNRLFNDQKTMKRYVKKDYIRVYDGRVQGDHAKLTCHTLTDKLIDFSQGELVVVGSVQSTTGTPLANNDDISIQNGFYSILKDVKISFNNNEVEHNREPLFTTTYLNLLEYSPDYASSLAVQYGFIKDTGLGNTQAINTVKNGLSRGTFTVAPVSAYPFTLTIALRDISQFIRRLNFPIMNQLFEIEFNINAVQSIIHANGVEDSKFTMGDVTLFVPEVVLPTKETQMLVKEISNGKFVKELMWDNVEVYTKTTNVAANTPFNELLGTNLTGVHKIIAVVIDNINSQEHNKTTSEISISDFNIEIDSKDYFNMNIRTDQEAYRLLVENFNMGGRDMNTGSLLQITHWKTHYRIYAVDLSRQIVFEADPYVSQTIRLRGTPNAAGQLKVFMFKNKTTEIDYSNPQNTRTVHN